MDPDPEVVAPAPAIVTPPSLVGCWRIHWMDLWSQENVEIVGPGYVELNADGSGEIRFICVEGWLDCELTERAGRPAVDFSWEGADDGEARCGRGWLRLGDTNDAAVGHFFFHRGDNSAFKAERVAVSAIGKRRRRARRRR